MPHIKGADGVRWSVRRHWMPLLHYLDMASWGNSTFGAVMFVLALPFILAWPFWLLAKFCGVPWKVVVKRDDDEVAVEKITGWRASGRRIDEIVRGVQICGRVIDPGEQVQDLRPYT